MPWNRRASAASAADVVVLQARAGRLAPGAGDGRVLPEVGEGGRLGRVELVDAEHGAARLAVVLHGPGRGAVAAPRRGAARGGRPLLGGHDVARVLILVHVEDHVDALLARPPHDLRHPVEVRRRVGPRRGLQLAPVEDQADDVEPEGPHLREVVPTARCGRLRERGTRRLDLAQRRLGDQRRRLRAASVVGRRRHREDGGATVRARIGDVLHPDRRRAVQQDLAPGGVGQIRRDVGAARRRDDVEEGQGRDAGARGARRGTGCAGRHEEHRGGDGGAHQRGRPKEARRAGHGGAT